MHAFKTHIDLYTSKHSDPIHYKGAQQLLLEKTEFAQYCLPLLKQRFHLECKVMQQALHLFNEVSPTYLGGNNGISLSINISHNFANSSHYDSLDFGPLIVLWVMDDDADRYCDQCLVFNNVMETINNEERKSGLLIKISDGMIMSFQGDTLRHGTTIRPNSITGKLCPPGNIYGIHFGLSMPSLTSFRCIRIDQYIREMIQIPKMVIRKKEDNVEFDDDMSQQGKTLKKI